MSVFFQIINVTLICSFILINTCLKFDWENLQYFKSNFVGKKVHEIAQFSVPHAPFPFDTVGLSSVKQVVCFTFV